MATSTSLRLAVREWSRSISNALRLVDGVALHQDPLGALDEGTTPERALEVVVLGEAAQHDVDRALPVVIVGVLT